MQLLKIALHRIGYGIVLMIAVLILNFLLIHIAPGDPADTIAGEMGGATEEMLAQIRTIYGLDKSLPQQICIYLGKAARGNLGNSFFFDMPVTELILQRVPATILLVMSALILSVLMGTFMGILSAQRPNSIFSHLITVLSLIGYSAPVFWTGLMLLILFSSVIPLFPTSGMYDVLVEGGFPILQLDILHHLVLPMLTLAIVHLAIYSRLSRASMLDVMGSDYIRTARAKGMSKRNVVYKQALRNAVIPVITMTGLQMSRMFAGAILVETVFSWPGLGQLAFESIVRRDQPTLLGVLFFSTLIVIVMNILTDLSYAWIDPRIRAENK
ncbi:MAG: ABC transporter permease [Deltaproteobacteria bacterium]|nr:ABC transporter permease [Deltaproteobacteria bacterium]